MEDIIIYGEGTSSLVSSQTTEIYLEDYTNKEITKQVLLDILLLEIYDDRDGDILKHTNNVQVDITRQSDNVLVDSITSEGFYDIRMTVSDSDSNVGTIYWKNRIESLNTDVLTMLVKENKAPVVTLNNIRAFNLADFMPTYKIERTNLNDQLVNVVLDDRDGIILTDILNVRILQNGVDGGTNAIDGTNFIAPSYPNGTSGTSGSIGVIEVVDPAVELLFIDEVGEYTFKLTVTDSDNATTVADFIFNVYY
jgi:hypothetical protein